MWGNEGTSVWVWGNGEAKVGLRRGGTCGGTVVGDVGFVAELEGGVGNQDQS